MWQSILPPSEKAILRGDNFAFKPNAQNLQKQRQGKGNVKGINSKEKEINRVHHYFLKRNGIKNQ